MAAIAAIDQGAVQGTLQQRPGECEACDKPVAGDGTNAIAVQQQAQTRAVIRLRAGSVAQVFSARLMSSAGARASATGYDSGESIVPQFLRAVAARLSELSSPVGRQAVIDQARTRVDEAAADAQALVDSQGEPAERSRAALIDGLGAGLDALQRSTGVPSAGTLSAAETTARYEFRAKLALNIRTQDGDVVRLRFKVNQVAEAVSQELRDGDMQLNRASLFVASDERFRVAIDGHLDEAELEAIQNVLAQADEIAGSVLKGDFDAVLEGLSGFGFDSEELSSVGMRLRIRERIQMTHTELSQAAEPAPVADAPQSPGSPGTGGVHEARPDAGSEAPAAQSPAPTLPAPDPAGAVGQMLHELLADTRMHTRVSLFSDGAHSRLRVDRELVVGLVETLLRVRATPQTDAEQPADPTAAEPAEAASEQPATE